jgi:glycosyltransferase involved in cell wall biosynthesis
MRMEDPSGLLVDGKTASGQSLRLPAVRVGILADTVGHPGGIGRYTTELLGALGRRADIRLVVAAPTSRAEIVRALVPDTLDGFIAVPDRGQFPVALWERYVSGRAFEHAEVALVHGTKHLVPRTRLPTVLTVHDVMTLTRARESSWAKRLFLPHQYRASIEQATSLIAASAATRLRLRDLDPRWDAKAVIARNGLSRHLLEAGSEPVSGLDPRFALVVGDLAPRKNVGLLLSIWDRVAAESGLELVVLGNPGPHSAELARRLVALEARGHARWLRGASDATLRWCYEHATVVLFPTLEEGFGFPVLEAATFHAPVLASTDLAIVEVAAGLANVAHIDATDPDAWLRAIVEAARVPRGPVTPPEPPAGAATWDENAAQVVELYAATVS